MSADFRPTQTTKKGLSPFRYWVQRVLPIVYDDSLSYQELLGKVVDYLNNVITDVNAVITDVDNLYNAYEQLEQYVNDYFDNLDLQEQIDNKLDEMAADGSLTDLISPFIPDLVTDWLTNNVDPVGSAVIVDSSLSIAGAAADAKVTGDKITGLSEYADQKDDNIINFVNAYNNVSVMNFKKGQYPTPAVGETVDISTPVSSDTVICGVFECKEYDNIYINVSRGTTSYRQWAFLDEEYKVVQRSEDSTVTVNTKLMAPANAAYFISNCNINHNDIAVYKANNIIHIDLDQVIKTSENVIKAITDVKPLLFKTGYYITGAIGNVYDLSEPVPASLWICSLAECNEGDILYYHSTGSTGGTRSFAFYDEDGAVITRAGSNFSGTATALAPEGAKYVAVNSSIDDKETFAFLGTSVTDHIEDINSKIEVLEKINNVNYLTFVEGSVYATPIQGEVVDIDNPHPLSGKSHAIAGVHVGDFVHLKVSAGSSSYRQWAFLDEEYKVVIRSTASNVNLDTVLVAPDRAKFVIVNTSTDYDNVVYIEPYTTIEHYGNVGMFDSIAVVGTSWDAGYFYSNFDGTLHAYTRRNKAWIKILADMYGITGYNFGVTSGTTCLPNSPYIGQDGAISWQGNANGWTALNASNVSRTLYFMDLQKNDANKLGYDYIGSLSDINDSDYTLNPDTYYGNYARIVEMIKAKDPHALFIFMYHEDSVQLNNAENTYAIAVKAIADHYGFPAINWFEDNFFKSWAYTHLTQNHPEACDYAAFAKVVDNLFSIVLRDNWDYFKNYLSAEQ